MQATNEMRQGWNFSAGIMGADAAAHMGQDYVSAVEEAIKELEININNHRYRNLDTGRLQGYLLEEWAGGTFNVDAAAAGSSDYADVLGSRGKNSVDIRLKSGGAYSAKSYTTAEKTAYAQAQINPETGQPNYYGQRPLVPADLLSDVKAFARRQELRNKPVRPELSESYGKVAIEATDVIQNSEGVSSKGATRKELEEFARECKKQNFQAEKHGVTADSAIRTEYLLKQALKAGYTAAAITFAIQLAPEIYKSIDYLIKHGEIDIHQIRSMGEKGISAGAEGFLRGSVSSAILIMCEKGALGEPFRGINPTALGTVVAVVMQTVKNSVLVAAGKMSKQQMGAAFADSVILSGFYLLGAHIGGMIGQALTFELPVLGFLLGSLIGFSFSVIYNIGKNKLISFCVDTGFTCFGLVEQNYELPDEVLKELGIETIPILRTQVERVEVPQIEVQFEDVSTSEYETIHLTTLRRGVIGVNKIGYVPA